MKEIYMIYEDETGTPEMAFANEKDAKDYCELKNNGHVIGASEHYRYNIEPITFYDSVEEYKCCKIGKYKYDLKNAIESLKNSIAKIENNNIVEKGYEKSKEQLKDMKTTLKKYQKEFVELCGSEKQTAKNAEEKELTK